MSSPDLNAKQIETDPVCGMKVSPSRAAGSSEYKGKTIYFCALSCKKKFDANPEAYYKADTANGSTVAIGSIDKKPETKNLETYFLPDGAYEYICPMDTQIRQKTQGICPLCGMALEPIFPQAAANLKTKDELQDMSRRFWISLPFTVLLIVLTMPSLLASLRIDGIYMPYLLLAFASIVLFYCGFPILRRGYESFATLRLNMFALLTLGSSISYFISILMVFSPVLKIHDSQSHLFFESSATIITLVLLGQVLELKARKHGKSALENLLKLAPSIARKIDSGKVREISVVEIVKGDKLQVLAGDKIPVDGIVLEGQSTVNDSILSGNELPKKKAPGDQVFAGTINLDGTLQVEAKTLGRDTVFAHILSTLSKVQVSRSRSQDLADTISAYFIPSVICIACVTFTYWAWFGGTYGLTEAILYSVSVLVIACPCALGLATPLALSAAITRGARSGLLIKDAGAIERLAVTTDILLDKTGTLTQGKFELKETIISKNVDGEDEAIKYAASLEQLSKHPLARGICNAAAQRNVQLIPVAQSVSTAGAGIEGSIENKAVIIGSDRFLKQKGIDSSSLNSLGNNHAPASIVYLAVDQKPIAKFLLTDPSRDEAPDAISALKTFSITPAIVSGDDRASVSALAHELGIDEKNTFAELLPDDKVNLIRKLQAEKHVVAMIGDGVNDAAALSIADVGIAMSSGSDIALSAAPLTIMHADLSTIPKAVKLSKLMLSTMKENLFLAFLYNVVAVICASGALSSFGITLNPTIAAAAMSLSSLSVILNSMKITNSKL